MRLPVMGALVGVAAAGVAVATAGTPARIGMHRGMA